MNYYNNRLLSAVKKISVGSIIIYHILKSAILNQRLVLFLLRFICCVHVKQESLTETFSFFVSENLPYDKQPWRAAILISV